MKLFVSTSDQYRHLIPAHVALINKYWKRLDGEPYHIVVLSFQPPPGPIPDNVEVVRLGSSSSERAWADPLIEFFSSLPDPYFHFSLEDYLLIYDVDAKMVDVLEAEVSSGRADKCYLTCQWSGRPPEGWPDAARVYGHPYDYDDQLPVQYRGLLTRAPKTRFDISPGVRTQEEKERARQHAGFAKLWPVAAIWSRSYFLRHLRRGMSLQQFCGFRAEHQRDDGAMVTDLNTGFHLYRYVHVYTKGNLTPEVLGPRAEIISPEDIELVRNLSGVDLSGYRFRWGY